MRVVVSTGALVGIGMAITLGALVLAFGPPLRRDMRAKQILAAGTPAEARVLDLKDTLVRYSDQPQLAIRLEVLPKDRPPYQVVIKRVVSPADLDLYARGRILEVKYDPAHPDQVAIVGPAPR